MAFRIVSQSSPVWKCGGLGSTDVSSLMGCGFSGGPLVLWGQKVEMREGTVRKLGELDQGTTEWHEWRAKGIGGSEVSSVMSANPWKSAARLYKEKLGLVKGEAENENMKRGKDLEPSARQTYQDLTGWVVRPCCVLHSELDFVRCSLDGLRDDDQLVVEIKAPKSKGHAKNLIIASEPDPRVRTELFKSEQPWYYWQCSYQTLITDAPNCHFVSYCPGEFRGHEKIAVIPLERNLEDEAYLLERVKSFWYDHVLTRIPPPKNW